MQNVAVLRQNHFMQWIVQYKQANTDKTARAVTPEDAIRTACQLLDDGEEVCGIGTGSLTHVIGKECRATIKVRTALPRLKCSPVLTRCLI